LFVSHLNFPLADTPLDYTPTCIQISYIRGVRVRSKFGAIPGTFLYPNAANAKEKTKRLGLAEP